MKFNIKIIIFEDESILHVFLYILFIVLTFYDNTQHTETFTNCFMKRNVCLRDIYLPSTLCVETRYRNNFDVDTLKRN